MESRTFSVKALHFLWLRCQEPCASIGSGRIEKEALTDANIAGQNTKNGKKSETGLQDGFKTRYSVDELGGPEESLV